MIPKIPLYNKERVEQQYSQSSIRGVYGRGGVINGHKCVCKFYTHILSFKRIDNQWFSFSIFCFVLIGEKFLSLFYQVITRNKKAQEVITRADG